MILWCSTRLACLYLPSSLTRGSYLIFMDDDAQLEHAAFSQPELGGTVSPFLTENPWRTFENYLLEYMPAIGFPHFSWHSRNESLEVQSVALFDAMITAFHADVWKFMFPYESRWDDKVCYDTNVFDIIGIVC
jgi:hypothetical protein